MASCKKELTVVCDRICHCLGGHITCLIVRVWNLFFVLSFAIFWSIESFSVRCLPAHPCWIVAAIITVM